jgi:hypothetical protein
MAEGSQVKIILVVLALLVPGMAAADETLEQRCTSDDASSYRGEVGHKTYVYDVENKCDFRLRCQMNIAIYNSFGMKLGQKRVTIEPKSHASLVLKLKAFGGMNSHEAHCRQM